MQVLIKLFNDTCSGLSAGIGMTCGPEECFYALRDCKANAVVVENEMQLNKILQVAIYRL